MNAQTSIAADEYILDLYERIDRVAILVLNRDFRGTVQRITSAGKAASTEFQAWLRHKNACGSDIYIGMNPLKQDAAARTKEEIASIRHVYIDLDYGGTKAVGRIGQSSLVPRPNYVLATSPDRFQIVWKVEEMKLDDAETLLHALAREFGGDPAATDASRVLRLPGFANKKYEAEFYVTARKESAESYRLHDFKLCSEGQDSLQLHRYTRVKRGPGSQALSQSEHDWAFAKRALRRGEDPEAVIQQIARHRINEKSDPQYYARLTVRNAATQLGIETPDPGESSGSLNEQYAGRS